MNPLFSQNTSLIQLVSNPNLTPQQDSLLEIVKNDSFTTGWRICTLNNLSSVQDSGCIKIELPFIACENLIFQSNYIDYENDSNYYWAGEIPSDTNDYCNDGYFKITKYNNIYTGRLLIGDSFYHIHDLGYGILVIANESDGVDSSNCGLNRDTFIITQRSTEVEDFCEKKVTKILMCYTEAAQKKTVNIEPELKHMVNLMNETFSNTQIEEYIEMVGTLKFHGFVESTDLENDFVLFYTNTSLIQAWRDNLHADLCGLVTTEYTKMNKVGNSGISSAMQSNQYNKNAGFFLCGITRGGGKQIVAVHEAGHCYWGDHYSSGGVSGASCAHAWKFTKGLRNYKTAINSDPDNNTFITYFSNPSVKYKNKSTGYQNSNENYCTIDWYKLGVRTYYTELNVFHGSLNSFGARECNAPQTLFAQPHCGSPPYTYAWYRSLDGFNFQLLSNSISTTYQLPKPPNNQKEGTVYIKLTITDGLNNQIVYKKSIRYNCP